MELGIRIREEREKKGWTRDELAEKMGKSFQSIYDWEHGKSVPGIESLISLSKIFQISTDSLLFRDTGRGDFSEITRHLEGLSPEQLNIMESIVAEVRKAMKGTD